MSNTLISVKEAAKIAKLAEGTIRNYIKDGTLTNHTYDRQILVDKRELLEQIPVIISLFNQKGGVGKTTLVKLLKDFYEDKNKKILLLDFDAQANISKTHLSYEELSSLPTLYNYMNRSNNLKSCIQKLTENVDIIPAHLDLYDQNNIDSVLLKSEHVPKFKEVFKKYDIILIDCPPARNVFSTLAVLLSNYIIIPVEPDPYSYDGFRLVFNTIQKYQNLATDLIDFKVVMNKYDGRTTVSSHFQEEMKDLAKNKFLDTPIPAFVGFTEAITGNDRITDLYSDKNPALPKIKKFLIEIDKYFYEERI